MGNDVNNPTKQTPEEPKRGVNGSKKFNKTEYMREYMKKYRDEHRELINQRERDRQRKIRARAKRDRLLLQEQGEKRNG